MATIVDLQKRVSWVMKKIIERNGLSKKSFSESLGFDTAALVDFLNLRAIIETEGIIRLSDLYGVRVEWIYTGKKSPFYPDGSRPAALEDDTEGADRIAASPGESPFTPDVITECLEKLKRIIESKSRYALSLAMLVNFLHRALENEIKLEKQTLKHKELKEKIRVLEEQLEKEGL